MIESKSFRWNECRAITALLGTVVMGLSAHVQSDEHALDTLQVHGFLSQALVITDDNNFFGHSSRDKGSLEFPELGLNVSLRPHQDVLVAAQVLSRRAGGNSSDAEPKLDYGLVDYHAASSAIGQIRYEHDAGRIVAAVSTANANADYESPANSPGEGRFRFQPWVLSFQYNEELWTLTAEYAIRKLELEGFNSFSNSSRTGESWYVQFARRFNDNWQWLFRYDSLTNNREDSSGKNYEAMGLGPAHTQFADDLTFGLQWTPHPQLMLAGEYHHVDGTGWLPTQNNTDSSATSRKWNMWLFQLSLRF